MKEEEDGVMKEEEDGSDCEPRFRVGESCYKGVSPALNSHSERDHMTSESPGGRGAAQEKNRAKKKKKKKKELRRSRTSRLKRSLQRAATALRKKDRRMLGNRFDGKVMVRRAAGSALLPDGPSFQLICSSVEDLRVLIRKTEDQLQELSGKQRSERRPNQRAAVKELHITLIRLLNELLPWEPKLVKAFQRNRTRLKKECEDFRKHPEYKQFVREPVDECVCRDGSAGRDGDEEVRMDRTIKDECEATENVNLGNHESRPEMVVHSSESGPFTRSSKRRQIGAIGDDLSLCKRSRADTESSELNVDAASREQATVIPRASALPQPLSSFQGSCKPIQALLAKSVGNKVTLISHPTASVMAQDKASVTQPPVRSSTTTVSTETPTTTSTTESTEQVVYKTAGGVGLLRKGSTPVKFSISDQKSMQHVVILPSNLLIQSVEDKAAKTSAPLPKTPTYVSNASGFTIPENKVPVQQVAPLRDTSTARAPSAVVTPNLRSIAVPRKTTEPNKSASSGPTKSDAKQELRTVCIRDSQSILVTTRGGNTGVVKVQTSDSGTGALPPSQVFTISPQLQAFLVSKSSTSTNSITPQAPGNSSMAPSTLNPISNDGKASIPGKSTLLAPSKESNSVLVTAKDILQNTASKCETKPPRKRPLPGTQEQSAFQKVFLVSPSPNIPSKVSTTTAACTLPGSRVMFISNSALTIPKEASEVKASSTSTPALKVLPKLGTALSLSTSSGTNVQSIGVPGLMSRILGTNKSTASAAEASMVVSRVPEPSPIAHKSSSRSLSGNTESSLKVPGTVDGKTLTFSTLGTGHMASSALLSVVKPDVPSSISRLSTLHCKPGLTSTGSSSHSGGLVNKHATLPVDATASNTRVITSFCTSLPLMKTTSSGVSSPLALRPPTSSAKSVQEKIVINTTAPLAPGTQLLINNTRFVVPSQGLGPGSHVLLINSSPASPVPRGPNCSTPPSVIQGMRLVAPVRLPLPNVGPSDRVHQQMSAAVRLPVFQSSEVSQGGCPKETSPPQGGLRSTSSPMLLHGRPSQNQVPNPPMKAPPMVSVPPTISRMQKLPVAMVPPIGGPAAPIASVPPSMNSVVMTPCPPIRAVQPGTIGKPAILPQPLQGQNPVPGPSKLLLSPDGAILNLVQVLAKPMAARAVGSSSSSVTVPRNDPLGADPDSLGRPRH